MTVILLLCSFLLASAGPVLYPTLPHGEEARWDTWARKMSLRGYMKADSLPVRMPAISREKLADAVICFGGMLTMSRPPEVPKEAWADMLQRLAWRPLEEMGVFVFEDSEHEGLFWAVWNDVLR